MLPFQLLIATCKQANHSIIKANWSGLARVQRNLKIRQIMCTNDTHDRVSIDGSDRHVGRRSVDMSTDTWLSPDQQQGIVGRVSTESCVGQ